MLGSATLNDNEGETNYSFNYFYNEDFNHQLDSIVSASGDVQTYAYNSSGSIETITSDFNQEFVWNVDQWLSGVENEFGIHHYIYDSKGERIMKSTLTESIVSINDVEENRELDLEPYKVYVNAHYIEHEFSDVVKLTKHYYMGAQRVASQAGYLGPRNIHVESPHDPVFSNLRKVRAEIKERTKDTPIGQITIEPDPFETVEVIEHVFDDLDLGTNVPDNLRPRVLYWYHPDYIGNVDLITDQTGFVYQFFMYNPWGENLYEYDAGSGDYNSPYRFNGKELDPETGNYYYGARYYDPKISVWLSVDPLANESPSQTPYHFVSNNPVMRVDPNGEKDVVFNDDGSYKETTNNNFLHNLWYGTRGVVNNSDGEMESTFRFNNTDDADRFELNSNEEGYLSGIDTEFLENNLDNIVDRGTSPAEDMSLKDKYSYIYNESMGGNLDYCCTDFDVDKLYVIGGAAYDNYDAGNFVWGRAMSVLNVPFEAAKLCSEFNGFWNGKEQNGEWSPGKSTGDRITWGGDSGADQRAIKRGYDYPYIIFR